MTAIPDRPFFLFRFRDLVAPTISEHQEIIREKKACWWGWWRRPTENNRSDVWDALVSELKDVRTVDVGLFDSGSGEVRIAKVTEVVPPGLGANQIQDPSFAALVPEYYRKSPFSHAWMKITEIGEPIDGFYRNFRYAAAPPLPGIPPDTLAKLTHKKVLDRDELAAMDTTIWVVEPAEKHDSETRFMTASTRVTEPISMAPIAVKGRGILHLSDLHFASGAHSGQHAWKAPGEAGLTLAAAIKQAGIGRGDIGIIVASGDFTFAARPEEFEQAAQCLAMLQGMFDLGSEHVVIVPGNHDIAWTKAPGENRGADELREATAEAQAAYRKFFKRVIGQWPNDDLSMGRRYILPDGITVDIAALNSTTTEQGPSHFPGLGRVSKASLDNIVNGLDWRTGAALALKLLVVHHHLVPPEDVEDFQEFERGFGMAIDGTKILRRAASSNVQIVLHGHRHRQFIWRSGVYHLPDEPHEDYVAGEVTILGAGSCGSTSLPPGATNFFNVLRVGPRCVEVDMWRSKDGSFSKMSTWRAPLALREGKIQLDALRPVIAASK